MFTISLIGEASAGKTTLAMALAVAAERAGLPTMLVDLDPGGSIMAWTGMRKAEAVNAVPRHAPMCCSAPTHQLRPVLEAARTPSVGARMAVIDTASGADADTLDAATQAAHVVLVPCRPADLTAIGPCIDLARRAARPTFVVLNDVPIQHRAGFTTVPQARTALAAFGIDCSPIVMYHRPNHVQARASGLTAQERYPMRPAAREIGALFAWVEGVELIKTDRAQDDDAQSSTRGEARRKG